MRARRHECGHVVIGIGGDRRQEAGQLRREQKLGEETPLDTLEARERGRLGIGIGIGVEPDSLSTTRVTSSAARLRRMIAYSTPGEGKRPRGVEPERLRVAQRRLWPRCRWRGRRSSPARALDAPTRTLAANGFGERVRLVVRGPSKSRPAQSTICCSRVNSPREEPRPFAQQKAASGG